MKKRRRINPDTIVLLKQVGKGCLPLSVLAILVLGIWHGSRVDTFTINAVEVAGGETIKHETVEGIVYDQLQGTYLGLVPRTFSFTYPHTDIVNSVSQLERVYDVTVERENYRTLSVEFNEFTPFALWCSEAEGTGCLFVNEEGYAFARAPDLQGGTFLRFTSLGQEPAVGDSYVEPEQFTQLLGLVELLENIAWFPRHIVIDQVGDISVFLSGGGELKVSGDEEPLVIMDNLRTVLLAEEFNALQPGNFAYIDLRFGNKVYVNVEGSPAIEEEVGGVSSSTATATDATSE